MGVMKAKVRNVFRLDLALAIVGFAEQRFAARFHIKTIVIRFSGDRPPADWSDANCYPVIHLAGEAATVEDSILLFRETHSMTLIR